MKRITLLLIVLQLIVGITISNAQAPVWSKLYSFGGDLPNRGMSVIADASNVFMAAQISGTVSFDGVSYTSAGKRDILLVKSNLAGASVWKKQVSPINADGILTVSYIKIDNGQSIYLVGRFTGTATIGSSTITSGPNYNSFIAKFDVNGNGVWATAFNNNGTGFGGIDFNRMAFDGNKNIYLVSRSNLLLKFDSTGIKQWEQGYPNRTVLAIAVNGSNLYLGGALQSGTTFGSLTLYKQHNGTAYNNGFLVKGDFNGNFSASTVFSGFSGMDGSSVSDIAFDNTNNIILTGACTGQTIFGSFSINNPSSSVYNYIAKCDNNFNFYWVNSSANYNPTRETAGYRIFLDNSNNIFLVGSGFPSITFNGITATNTNNYYYFKFAANGTALTGYNLPVSNYQSTFVSQTGDIYFSGATLNSFGNILYARLNSDATWNWSIESTGNTSAAVAIIYTKKDNAGNIYTLAGFHGTGSYFGNAINTPVNIFLLTKCDASGNSIWMKQIEGYNGISNQGAQLFIDKNNNVLFTGTFSTSLTIGTTTFTNLDANNDGFIAVFAPDGTITMLKQIVSSDLQEIDCIIKDNSGNIILSGIGKDLTIDGSTLPNLKNNDVFLVKLTASGNLIWANFYSGDGSTGTDWLALVASDKNDNLFLSGEFHANPCDMGNITLPLPDGMGSVVLSKIDPNGYTLWAKSFSGVQGQGNDGWPDFIHLDTTGNVILYGWCPNNAIFDGFVLTNPIGTGYSYFISKINTSGKVVWAKAIYEKTFDFNYGDNLDLDSNGNIYIAGHLKDDISIEGTVYPKLGTRALFVAKYNNNGDFKWIKEVPSSTSGNLINGISVYGNDKVLVAGVSTTFLTFGSFQLNSYGNNWGYLAVLDGFSPLTGTKTINPAGGDYTSFTSAISDLNDKGVGSGGVTFLVAADAVFSDVNMTILATGTASDPIKFIKNGTGANPVLQSKGVANSNGDFFINVIGGDYITFDGIDFITDPAALDNEKIERVLLFNGVAGNGNQYITVQNCSFNQQTGINTAFRTIVFNTQGVDNPAGRTKFITIKNSVFENCNTAIRFNGNALSFISDIVITQNQFGTATASLSLNDIIVALNNVYNVDVHHNTFQNINTDYLAYAISGNVGIGLNQIYNNKMFNFKSTHSGDEYYDIMGISIIPALNAELRIYNNLIYDFDAPGADVPSGRYFNITPIYIYQGIGKVYIYNNTIKMSSANPNVSSIVCWVSGNAVVKNNIFVNTSVANTNSFSTIAYLRSSDVFCDNIIFYDTTLAGHTFNENYTTIEGFYNAVYNNSDIDSAKNANIDPNLDANFVPQNPSAASNNGIFSPKAATDFNDVTRTGFDIGAFEGNFGPQTDIWFPAIKYIPLQSSSDATMMLSAEIIDNVGVSANPKLWYRASGSAAAFTAINGVYNAGSLNYDFTFPALSPGEYEYFVCAKDAAGNIISNPAISGLSAANTGLIVNNPAAGSVTVRSFGYKLAQLETAVVSSITYNSAVSGGIITSDNGAAITARGVCWSLFHDPTIADSQTTDGSGIGTYTSSITGLLPGTNYYARAYATSSAGTAYGSEIMFTTSVSPINSMNNDPVTMCSGLFYDSGGESGNYADNEDFTKTFYPPTPGDRLSFTFNYFVTEAGYDFLYIYDGPDIYSPQFPGSPFSGNQSPGTITALPGNNSGAITFRFVSDYMVNDLGWEASFNVLISDVYSYSSANPACLNEEVYFSVSGSGNAGNYNYLWDFGDGSPTSSLSYPSHAYTSVGNYSAWVNLSNSCGNDTTLYETVQVRNSVPVTDVGIYFSQTTVCPNEEVYFEAWTYGGNYNYLWDFGDGSSTSTTSNTRHKYNSPGSYLAWVKISNACGSDTILYQTVDVLNNMPVSYADFSVSPNPVCPGDEVSFQAWGGDGYTYSWNYGDGSPAVNGSNTSHSYSIPGSYPAYVKVTNLCGSNTFLYQTVEVADNIPITNMDYNISPNPVCPNDEVSFHAYGNYSYLWNFGDGSPASGEPDTYHTYPFAGTYPVALKVTNGCGNDSTVYQTVLISNNIPVTNMGFNISQNPVCPNDNVSFEAWGNASSYVWDFGDSSLTSNSDYTYHKYASAGSYEATVIMTNSCGNSGTSSQTVLVMDNLPVTDVSLYISPNPVCPNDEVTFEASGSSSYSYEWSFGDGSPVTSTSYTSHTYTIAGNYDVWVKITNACGKDTTLYGLVQVQNNVPASYDDFSVDPNPVCPNGLVSFQVWSSAGSYLWNFGDGSPATTINHPYHSYSAAGSYPASVKITNGCGNEMTLNETVNVQSNLVPSPDNYDYDALQNEACPGDSIVFYVQSGAGTYLWDFGDGTSSTETTSFEAEDGYMVDIAYHSYATEGNYTVNFTLTNACGNSFTDQFSILVGNNIPVNGQFGWNISNPAPGENVEFWAMGGSIYQFDFGDGTAPLTITSPLTPVYHTYSSAGTYNISVTITNLCGYTEVYNDYIIVSGTLPLPEGAGIISGISTVCQGQNAVTYTVPEITRATSYIWTLPTGATGTSTSNSITVNYGVSAASGNITVYGSNPTGDGAPSSLPVTVNPFPANAGTISGLTAVCPGQNLVSYTVPTIVNATSYGWTMPTGASGTSTTNSITINYGVSAVSGNITVKGNNSCGDGALSSLAITVNSKPATPVITIAGSILHSDAVAGNQWFDQNGPIAGAVNQDYLVTTSGDYYVIVTLLGCSSEKSNIIPKLFECNALFDYSWDGFASFTNLSVGNPTSWSWDFGDGTSSTLKNPPPHNYPKDGSYTVTLTIFNSANNCVSSITKKVTAGFEILCQADFEAVINSVSGLAGFTSTSVGATGYYWDFGGGNYSIEANPEFTFTKAGFYPVCLTIWNDSTGCQSVSCKDILFIPESEKYIRADFSFFTDPADSTVIFNDLSTSNTTDWYWSMGDGKVMKIQNPEYTYAKPGVYNVCLTVFDNVNSLSNSVCKEVRVSEIPCSIASDFTWFINPATRDVAFSGLTSGAPDNYFWTFGDGSSSTEINPLHNYSNPGYYKVSLAVRNSSNNCMDIRSQIIQVGSVDCRAGFTYRVDPNSSTTVYFTDDSKGQVDYYYWDFGDGSFSVDQNPDQLYKNAGMYMVGQTVIDNTNACIDFTFQPVQVGEVNCAADFVSYIDSANFTAYFTNRVLGVSTALLWSFGDGKFSTEQNPVNVFPGTGIYSTGLNTYDFNNGCMDYYEEMLLIGGIGKDCNADFAYLVDPVSSVVTFSNKSTGDVVGSIWNFGDESDNSTLTDPVHPYTTGGYYYVCLSVINTAGTKNMGCKWVLIPGNTAADCRANFMFTIDTSTRKVKFVDNSYGDINKYTWDFGDSRADSVSVVQHPEHTYDQKGYYLVQLKVENTTSGCVSSEYKLLNIAEAQVLKAAFGYEAQEPNKKIAGYPVDLVSASSGDGATVEWDFGDKQVKKESFTVMDSTSRIVTHYYQKSGKYRVCLRISDPVSGQSDEYCEWVVTKNAIGVYELSESGVGLDVYPNPFMNYTTISYALPKPQFMELAVYDQLGRRIETLVKTRKDSGTYQVVWETKTLTTGVYHLKLVTADAIITKQLVISK